MASLREKVLDSRLVTLESRSRVIMEAEMRRRSGSSLEMVERLILMGGLTIAARPIRRRAFRVLLPMTVAMRTSVLPEMREAKETANSGALVPNATMVRPMSCLGTLKLEAVDEAPSTNQSAPLISKTNPIARSSICMIVSMSVFCYLWCNYSIRIVKCKGLGGGDSVWIMGSDL